MTHEELVLQVRRQQEEINRLNVLVKRLYDISELPRLETEEKILAQIEAKAEELAIEEAGLGIQANEGNVRAQFPLGFIYYHAKGVAEDSVQAVMWWHKAAEQGVNAEAQTYLGFAYANGWGVPKADVEAYKWYNLAASQGNERAKKDVGTIAERMAESQIAEAQKRSADFKQPRSESTP